MIDLPSLYPSAKGLEMSRIYVKCPHCQGFGTVELTGVYAETLRLVRQRPGLNGAALATRAGCNATAMNNRLTALAKHDLVVGVKFGRQIKWRVRGR